MQRFEVVAAVLKEIDKTIIFAPVAKYWGIDEQKEAMKKTETELKSVVDMSELVKVLLHHEYPVTAVTYVQPEQPGEMRIHASHTEDPPCVSIQFSPALLGEIADNEGKTFSEIEEIARESVQRMFYMTVDYIDAKICEEREWLDYLCAVLE